MSGLCLVRVAEQFPPLRGGLSAGMLALSLEQHRRGDQVTVITRDLGLPDPSTADLPFTVMRLRCRSLMHFGWQAASLLRRLPTPPDIVHCHGPAAAPILFRHRSGDPPTVLTLHTVRRYQYGLYRNLHHNAESVARLIGAPVHRPPRVYSPWSPRIFSELMLEAYLCRGADHLALVAAYFGPLLTKYYGVPSGKCTVTYNGSDMDVQNECRSGTALTSPSMARDEKVILHVGRVEWGKRIELLVQAMVTLLKYEPKARLLVVGEGEQREDLGRLIASLHLDAYVRLCGWVEHSQLQTVYRAADCLCLPSISEGQSKVLLEAMSMGLPIVASDGLANRELLQDGKAGLLVDSADPDSWAAALREVLSNPAEASPRTRRALTLVDEQYRWRHVADRLDRVYRELVQSRSQPRQA